VLPCGGVHPELCAWCLFRERGGANLDWSRGIPHARGPYTFTHSGTTVRRAFPARCRRAGTAQGRTRLPIYSERRLRSRGGVHPAAPRRERTDITCHFLFELMKWRSPASIRRMRGLFWIDQSPDWAICRVCRMGFGRGSTPRVIRPDGRLEPGHQALCHRANRGLCRRPAVVVVPDPCSDLRAFGPASV